MQVHLVARKYDFLDPFLEKVFVYFILAEVPGVARDQM
jgi:hypothetical protein